MPQSKIDRIDVQQMKNKCSKVYWSKENNMVGNSLWIHKLEAHRETSLHNGNKFRTRYITTVNCSVIFNVWQHNADISGCHCHIIHECNEQLDGTFRQWVTLFFTETKVSDFSLRPKYQTKSLHLPRKIMKTKHNMSWMTSYNNCRGPNAENLKFFMCLPVRWDNRSETWFLHIN